jgi:hypothetical protein
MRASEEATYQRHRENSQRHRTRTRGNKPRWKQISNTNIDAPLKPFAVQTNNLLHVDQRCFLTRSRLETVNCGGSCTCMRSKLDRDTSLESSCMLFRSLTDPHLHTFACPTPPAPSMKPDRVSPFQTIKLRKGAERLVGSSIQIQAQKRPQQVDSIGHVCGLLGGVVYHFGGAAVYGIPRQLASETDPSAIRTEVANDHSESVSMRHLQDRSPCDVHTHVRHTCAHTHARIRSAGARTRAFHNYQHVLFGISTSHWLAKLVSSETREAQGVFPPSFPLSQSR